MRRLLETAVCVCVALVLVGTWLVEPYTVVSGSMHPTLLGPHRSFECPSCHRYVDLAADLAPLVARPARCPNCNAAGPVEADLPVVPGDAVLVQRAAFLMGAPRRGEVIAFRLPDEPSRIGVKRIAGLPGETIAVVGSRLFVDGLPLSGPPFERNYAPPAWYRGPIQWRLAADEYFVVGDNPEWSDDSRTWRAGAGVAAHMIIGRPLIVHAPRRETEFAGIRIHVPDLSAIRYIR